MTTFASKASFAGLSLLALLSFDAAAVERQEYRERIRERIQNHVAERRGETQPPYVIPSTNPGVQGIDPQPAPSRHGPFSAAASSNGKSRSLAWRAFFW